MTLKVSETGSSNDIHLEKGMHCVDCRFRQDAHGDGNLYNEPRAAIEIVPYIVTAQFVSARR